MTLTKLKAGLGALAIVIAVTVIVLQYQTQQQLRRDNESLRQQIAQLKTENEDFSNRVTSAGKSEPLSSEQLSELLRLRGEVGALRNQTNQLARLRDENQKMREAYTNFAKDHPPGTEQNADQQQTQAFAILEINTSRQLILGMIMYAEEHGHEFPTNFDQAENYFRGFDSRTNFNRFEIVYQGSSANIANPSAAIVVREIQPWTRSGNWMKTYGFADGHSEVHRADPNGSFDEWEQQHVPVLKNQ